MSYTRTTKVTRFGFIKSLAKELIFLHLQKRITEVANLPRELKQKIQKILGNDAAPQIQSVPDNRLQKRKTCQKCPAGSDRKTQHKCIKCNLAICGQCQRRECVSNSHETLDIFQIYKCYREICKFSQQTIFLPRCKMFKNEIHILSFLINFYLLN